MMHTNKAWPAFLLLVSLLGQSALATEKLNWIQRPELTFNEKEKLWHVTFELDSLTDVEVAIVDPQSERIVRHLAAGVLGPKAPPPLIANSRAQKIKWDGRDDYGQPVGNPSKMVVRVRAGMSVKLDAIVGGDPYAFYSGEMSDGDHSPWGINGLEAKPDGKVYVWGHSSNLGPPALRQYDADGNYLQTLFPMPAGRPVEAMQGWGIHIKPDGTYAPKFNLLVDPSLTTTFLDTNLRMARLLPTPETDRLTFWRAGLNTGSFEQLTFRTDGTIAEDSADFLTGPLVKQPPLQLGPVKPNSHTMHSLLGPVFVCWAADGKSFYLSGVYSATTTYGTIQQVTMDTPWRDGIVWKVDAKTRTAKAFFSLDRKDIPVSRGDRAKAFGGENGYAALHGVAVDGDGHVFVCDRLNRRIVVLDEQAKIVREISVEHPDAIAISRRTGVVYVTTRENPYQRRGMLRLLKFADWRKDHEPAEVVELSKTGYNRKQTHSYLAVCETDRGTNVWVAYTQLPVRVYRDDSNPKRQRGTTPHLKLLKDFYRVDGAQRCLGFDRLQVDPATEEVYVLDAHDAVWKIADWKHPRFIKVPLRTASIAIDARRRHIFTRTMFDGGQSNSIGKVARFHLDRDDYAPANFGETGTNRLTPSFHSEWCFEGNSDKGIAVAPNGNIAVVGEPKDGLRVFAGDESKVPWSATRIADLPNNAGGVRFDRAGNLYVGIVDPKSPVRLPGFEGDRHAGAIGRIYKFAPTGSLQSGNLFPKPPSGPAQIYDVAFGAFQTRCVTRSPRFGVDGYGRIYFPTNIAQRVTVIDNAGNEILRFGTYGNRDSTGSLPGDLVPTPDIPLAFPNSVDATDDHIYVADMVNLRVLRLQKTFRLAAMSR